MGNQLWDQELQGGEGLRPLKLLPNEHSATTFDGLFDTLQKRCKLDTLTKYVSGNKQLTNKVVSKECTCKKSVLEFEKSHDNIVRIIATYYNASGVMGK